MGSHAVVAALIVLAACVSANVLPDMMHGSGRDKILQRIKRDPLYSFQHWGKKEDDKNLINEYGLDYSTFTGEDASDQDFIIPEFRRPGQQQDSALKEKLNVTEQYLRDPCMSVRCGGGAMCVVKDIKKQITACECPSACNYEYAPVCTNVGVQYDSKCHMHLEACRIGQIIEIAYEAACIAKSQRCTNHELALFPGRMLDWSLMVRDEEYEGKAKLSRSVNTMPANTQMHIAEWIFNKFDINDDKALEKGEQYEVKSMLLSVERCIEQWLDSCDVNKDLRISGAEWKRCILPGYNIIETPYFDALYNQYAHGK